MPKTLYAQEPQHMRLVIPTRVDGRPEAERPKGYWLQITHDYWEYGMSAYQTMVDYNFYSTEEVS